MFDPSDEQPQDLYGPPVESGDAVEFDPAGERQQLIYGPPPLMNPSTEEIQPMYGPPPMFGGDQGIGGFPCECPGECEFGANAAPSNEEDSCE